MLAMRGSEAWEGRKYCGGGMDGRGRKINEHDAMPEEGRDEMENE